MSKTAQKRSRAQLEALAVQQAQEIAELRGQLEKAQAQLHEREIVCERAGTMADAAMTLNGVFKAADDAAAQYLENIRAFTEEQHKVCAQIERTTREQAEAMLRETNAKKTHTGKSCPRSSSSSARSTRSCGSCWTKEEKAEIKK